MAWTSGYRLRCLNTGKQIVLDQKAYRVGSQRLGEEPEIVFRDSGLDGNHATLWWDEGQGSYQICQVSDQAKSLLMGLPLVRGTPRPLKPGTRLKLGEVRLIVEKEAEPPSAPDLPALVRVDESWLGAKVYRLSEQDRLQGPVAELYPDGQLKSLSIYQDGKLSSTHTQLVLEHQQEAGRAVSSVTECTYGEGLECVVTRFEGEVEYFEETVDFSLWVKKWIDLIRAGETVSLLPPTP